MFIIFLKLEDIGWINLWNRNFLVEVILVESRQMKLSYFAVKLVAQRSRIDCNLIS